MCGLLFTSDPAIETPSFQKALGTMVHRGPDAPCCVESAGHTLLGHNRLAILDLDPRSNQPFSSQDGRYTIVYNGEIYNYKELAHKHGIPLRTSGDTEVLVELFAKLGSDMLSELNGMFALVILDHVTGDIFAARDRLGIKPLYYRRTGDALTFASEISALIELFPQTSIDPLGLRQYKKLRTFFNGHTLYRDIGMFPAGCYLQHGILRTYWALPEGPQSEPTDAELRDLIESSVSYRKRSDVPLGSYLSGGIDSTIVTGLLQNPHTWTVGTKTNNEFEWARIAAEQLGTWHHEVLLDHEEFIDTARSLILRRKEPLSVPNEVLLYKMTQAVKEENTVVLSGEGADELFFGYDRVFRWAANASSFDLEAFDRHYSYGSHCDDEVIEDALSPHLDRGTPLDIVASFFQTSHLHGLLRRLDFTTMQSSVEARVPFVDHRLVERMAGVPYSFRDADGIPKAPIKRIFSDLVPEKLIQRKKVGFPVDLKAIFDHMEIPGETPMDRWLSFNLGVLGIDE